MLDAYKELEERNKLEREICDDFKLHYDDHWRGRLLAMASRMREQLAFTSALEKEIAMLHKTIARLQDGNRNHWRRTFVSALLCRGYTPSDAIKTAGHALAQIEELEESESQDNGKK